MGRKVHPYGFRLGIIRDWKSRWYAPKSEYTKLLLEDMQLRDYLRTKMDAENAGVSDITIDRFPPNQLHVVVYTARPGVVIGRKGAAVKEIREGIEKMTGKRVKLDIQEIVKPDLVAQLVADNIAQQIERRIPHNRAMKKAVQSAMQSGALGIKIECAGRLNGSEMKRTDKVMEGRIPRNTLRADIDFAKAEADTTYGKIGVKVWIYKGDVLPDIPQEELTRPSRTQQQMPRSRRERRGGRGSRRGGDRAAQAGNGMDRGAAPSGE
ncbi:MAG: 30S ribosomal protein S3 [Thermoflexales bacterium]|nr:30S ribosomal protein S3 [Thermoflexales bacterium]MDW8351281.1 30S ribosomal protein S3 [Anaerolineae bacterium]